MIADTDVDNDKKQLSDTLKELSQTIILQLGIINSTTGNVEYRKRRILDLWNDVLSPNSELVQALDNYGREVVWGYRSALNKHTADHLTLEEFDLYVSAVLSKMSPEGMVDFNESVQLPNVDNDVKIADTSDDENKKRFHGFSKPVICIETGAIYDNAYEAARCLNWIGLPTIQDCCKDQSKMAAGYHWAKYVE